MPTLTTLASFNGTDGQSLYGGLIADAAGDLFGTTLTGGAAGDGTVFELVNNGGGSYTPTTLARWCGSGPGTPSTSPAACPRLPTQLRAYKSITDTMVQTRLCARDLVVFDDWSVSIAISLETSSAGDVHLRHYTRLRRSRELDWIQDWLVS